MQRIEPRASFKPVSFVHELSGHRYEVAEKDGRLVHREVVLDTQGRDLLSTEREILWAMGSGTRGKSYLYKQDSTFGQSPISWYEESETWGISPGYDTPIHPGFGRKLSTECFFCHVGRLKSPTANPHQFSITEASIGCERCHGPGGGHVQHYAKRSAESELADEIINPAKLSREDSEAVCQQCHLQTAAKVVRAGKREWDFRPGDALTEVRIDYQFQQDDDAMQVVGHVEQLHASLCYQQSESLTCITCHNPHQEAAIASTADHYRKICLQCHESDSCGETMTRRIQIASDNCAQCHMPKQDTEVPHTALSHHRIGIHPKRDALATNKVGVVPVLDISTLDSNERLRCEAIAKFQVSQEPPQGADVRDLATEAVRSLIQLHNAGKSDPDADTVLALLARSQNQRSIAVDLARGVLETTEEPTRARIESLRLLAQVTYQQQRFAESAEYYQKLVPLHSQPNDWFQLGIAQQNTGSPAKAVDSLKRAIDHAPTFIEAHRVLSMILKLQQQEQQAQRHAELAESLQERLERLLQRQADSE